MSSIDQIDSIYCFTCWHRTGIRESVVFGAEFADLYLLVLPNIGSLIHLF